MLHLRAVQMGSPSSIGRRCRSPPACTRRQLLWIVARRPQVRLQSGLKSPNLSFSSLERDALFYRVQIRQRGGKWRPTDDRLRLCLSERLCALMARVLVLYASIFLSATEAAGATQKSDIQEWPFPAVSESCSRPCTLAGVLHVVTEAVCQPVAGVPGRPLGRTSGCVKWCDFSVVSTQKSIDTHHHSPPLCGGRTSGRRGHNAGSGRPQPRVEKNIAERPKRARYRAARYMYLRKRQGDLCFCCFPRWITTPKGCFCAQVGSETVPAVLGSSFALAGELGPASPHMLG